MTPNDEKQLRLLGRLHYVIGGHAMAIPLLGLLFILLGILLLLDKLPSATGAGTPTDGWFPVEVGLFFILLGSGIAGANFLAGSALQNRERRALCLLTALVDCLYVPLGTALGAYTIAVLCRPAVRAAFNAKSAPAVSSRGGLAPPRPAPPETGAST